MTLKRTQVIMLPTNEKAQLWLDNFGSGLYHTSTTATGVIYQHLYFLSDEEIKEGDWCYIPFSNEVLKVGKGAYEVSLKTLEENKNAKKIIATTDSSLVHPNCCVAKEDITKMNEGCRERNRCLLPQPSQDFIKVFVEEYNKGNVIEWVDVEYEEIYQTYFENDKFHKNPTKLQLKVNSKNEITIRKIKDSWNRDEVIELIKKFDTDSEIGHFNGPFTRNKWISENL
jgi:hypothetical protein